MIDKNSHKLQTGNTTTFQQKKTSHWQEVFGFPSNSSNINLPENHVKTEVQDGPKNYSYKLWKEFEALHLNDRMDGGKWGKFQLT